MRRRLEPTHDTDTPHITRNTQKDTRAQAHTVHRLSYSLCMWRVHQVHGEEGEKDSAI